MSPNVVTRACGIAAAALGFLALASWAAPGHPLLDGLGRGWLSMPPSTAFLSILFGIAVLFAARTPLDRTARFAGVAAGSGGALIALLLFFFSSQDQAPTDQIASVVALCFVLAGLSLVAVLASSDKRTWPAMAAFWLAVLVVLAGGIFLLADLFDAPLPNGWALGWPAPAAISTVLAALGTSLATLSGKAVWASGPRIDATSLRASRAFMLVFVLMATAIVTAGGIYFHRHIIRYRAEVERQLLAVVELKANELANWRAERLGDAKALYRNFYFARLVRRALDNPRDAEAWTHLHHWLQQVREAHGYDKISILDSKGVALVSVSSSLAMSTGHESAHQIPSSGQLILQDFHRHEAGGPPGLSLLAPIIDQTDGKRPLGFLMLEIDPRKYLYPLIKRWPTPSATAETLLVRRDGNDVLYLNDLRFRKDSALSLRLPLTRTAMPEARAALGQQGVVDGINYRGVPVIAALRPVPDTPWVLVAQVDTAEVIEPLAKSLWMQAILVGTVLLAAGTILALKWRHQLMRHYSERLRTLEELQKSEFRYRELFEANPHPMWVFDAETLHFLAVNDAAAAHYGYSRDEFSKLTVADVRPAEDLLWLLDAVADRRELKTFTSVRHRKKDGTLIDVEITAHALDFGGRRAEVVLVHDVTERKRAEERLRVLSRAVEQSPAATVITDTQGRFEYVNPKFLEVSGYTWEELAGKTPAVIKSGLTPLEMYQDLWRTIVSGKEWRGELQNRRKDGELYWEYEIISPLKNEQGVITHYIAVKEDITERIRLEQAQARLIGILDATPDFVSMADAQRRVTYLNPAARKLLGLGRDDDISHVTIPYSHPEKVAKLLLDVGIPTAMRDGIWKGESLFLDVTGCEVPMSQTIVAHKDANGEVEYISTVCRDMTEHKRTEATLQHELARHKETTGELLNARLRLAERDRRESIGRLAAGVAHEVKNPLAIIRLGVDYLARQPACASDQAEVLEDVRQASDRADRIISGLLNLSREKALERRPARIEEIVDNAIKLLNHEIVLREIVVARYYGSTPPLFVDPDLLQQVFINLLLNAIQAIGQAGGIDVVARSIYVNERDVQPDEIRMFAIGERLVLVEIKDNGPGIAPEHKQKLFDPFFTTKPTGEGTGLGLAVSRNIVMMHGGFISLSNRPEGGASALVGLRVTGERVANEEADTGSR